MRRGHIAAALGLGILAAIQVGLMIGRAPLSARDSTRTLEVGDTLESFSVLDSARRVTSLRPADLPPCTNLILFTETCPYCRRSAPDWAKDFGAASDRDAIGIALTTSEAAQSFAREFGLTFPVYADTTRNPAEKSLRALTPTVPRVVQLGAGGVVREIIRGGPYDAAALERLDRCELGE